eukprot:gi/632957120/ref/XP_007894302.1/ PREDICTED: uncharacterized protein C11orf57 homolog [Callorhinchus milii]
MARIIMGKLLLRNVIRHRDAHNKIQEESEMWKIREKEKQINDEGGFQQKRRKSVEGLPGGRMRCDGYSAEEAERRVDAALMSLEDERESRYWTKKLYDFEANDPNRWGHSGYKELYPEEFQSDGAQQGSSQENSTKHSGISSSKGNSRKRKRSSKSGKKKRKKKSHKKVRRKRRAGSSESSSETDSSEEEEEEEWGKAEKDVNSRGKKRAKRKHRKKTSKKPKKKQSPSSTSASENDSSDSSDCDTSSKDESDCRDDGEKGRERRRQRRMRRRRKKDSRNPPNEAAVREEGHERKKRKDWKAADDVTSDESGEDDLN